MLSNLDELLDINDNNILSVWLVSLCLVFDSLVLACIFFYFSRCICCPYDQAQSLLPGNKRYDSSIKRALHQQAMRNMSNAFNGEQRLSNFEAGHTLGFGSFGTVFAARHKEMKYIVAIKVIEKKKTSSHLFAQSEAYQKRLVHEHILRLHESFEDHENIYLILDYAHGGTLAEKLRKSPGSVSEKEAARIIVAVAKALQFCHILIVMHRDLKPCNLMYGKGGILKLADFGLATHKQTA